MYLIVGLGNPGKEYVGTRHNVGFDAIEYLADKNNVSLNKLKFNAVYGEYAIKGEKIILFKPLTYMNLSGNAVAEIVRFYKIPMENIVVMYDDIDIGLGALRIRPHGSSGTHNGMKSIIYQLQRDNFKRIRIGIGKKTNPNMDLADFVLQRFNKEERQLIDETIENAALASEDIINNGLNHAMEKFNKTI
ncbi:aminoacyl-tRNA hydrolase [Sedimentibacter sp. zth1]|uniref:aminoacyl-tRNA hydrolase n=1 Tax=Sedimentibacter sp. zth1 TaxID=2816908 RepID=UPI001A934511|nr:aminoacyl-tRNA hydrolase [Sedimentibacter sp. zth1]QSX04940.1 aminoacyl-tRNA hydrolase [Sedimentibacter sp. zth1]